MAVEPVPQNDATLDDLIAAFLQAVEEGSTPDREQMIAAHPECADELREFFQDHDRLWNAVRGGSATNVHDTTQVLGDSLNRGASAFPGVFSDLPTAGPLPFEASSVPSCATGTIAFGEYELLDEIARGGMGVVYRARQRRLNRTVALKMILTGQLANKDEVQRFYGEAEAAAQLEHPGIVPIHEIGQQEGLHYYTMSYVEGRSLADILREGPLAPLAAAKLLRKIALAIAYAHTNKVIHRDLKPGNILIDSQGEPHITDFGLAKRLDSGQAVTTSGQVLGTLQYMPPEQATGRHKEIMEAADIYALGGVLYAMLTGKPPFPATHPIDLLLQVIESEPVPPRRIVMQIPRELEQICLKCLEKDPARRYSSSAALAVDLELFLQDEPLIEANSNILDTVRRLPRRYPALCAHLAGLGLVELFRQSRLIFAGREVLDHEWAYHWQFSGIFALWVISCFAFHALLDRPSWSEHGRYLWAGADVFFTTWVLSLAHGPIGLLFMAFALLIVASGSFFRVRLVAFMSVSCILAFICVLILRPSEARPLHYSFVAGAVLALIGLIMGFHVHRLRALYKYYERWG